MLSGPVKVSLLAVITNDPSSRSAFCVRFVYVSSSLFPHPFPPISKVHFNGSTELPFGPLNSSLHTTCHPDASAWTGAITLGCSSGLNNKSIKPSAINTTTQYRLTFERRNWKGRVEFFTANSSYKK